MGVSSLGKDHTWEINLAARAAWMSFVGDMTQSEIAKRLGVSSARVHRLIQLAKHQGIVRISIEGRPSECLGLEAELATRFNLKSCMISPYLSDPGENDSVIMASVGQAAGQLLGQHLLLPQTRSVGIGAGPALLAAVEAMPQVPRPDLSIYPTTGSLSSHLNATPLDTLTVLERRTGARIHPLPAPFQPSTEEQRKAMLSLPPIRQNLDHAAGAQLYAGGVGRLGSNGNLVKDGLLTQEQSTTLEQAGALGEIFGIFVDGEGGVVSDPSLPDTIAIDHQVLRTNISDGKCRVIAIAADTQSLAAVRAVLVAGLITDLVLHEGLGAELAA